MTASGSSLSGFEMEWTNIPGHSEILSERSRESLAEALAATSLKQKEILPVWAAGDWVRGE